jgi:two-component system response regulator ChvI
MAAASVGDPHRILVVDDDPLFRESVEQNLLDAGFAVTALESGPALLDFLAGGGTGDLVLLDWKMPGMNGIEVLRRLRANRAELPVIFLTVLSDQIYEEAALVGGAVDFVEKARSFAILLKRIQLILGGTKGGPPAKAMPVPGGEVTVGALVLYLDSSRAAWGGRKVDLSLTEFRMVHHLATRAGKDITYRELYDLVHGAGFIAGDGADGYRGNVRTFVKRIRQKFRDVDSTFEQIENYPGFGYRWRR